MVQTLTYSSLKNDREEKGPCFHHLLSLANTKNSSLRTQCE